MSVRRDIQAGHWWVANVVIHGSGESITVLVFVEGFTSKGNVIGASPALVGRAQEFTMGSFVRRATDAEIIARKPSKEAA